MKLNTDDCKLKSLASNNMVPLISVTPHSPGTMYNVLGEHFKTRDDKDHI